MSEYVRQASDLNQSGFSLRQSHGAQAQGGELWQAAMEAGDIV